MAAETVPIDAGAAALQPDVRESERASEAGARRRRAAREAHLVLFAAAASGECGTGAAPIVIGLLAGAEAAARGGTGPAPRRTDPAGPWRRVLGWLAADE